MKFLFKSIAAAALAALTLAAVSCDEQVSALTAREVITAPNLYVVLDSSPLADILEPSEE